MKLYRKLLCSLFVLTLIIVYFSPSQANAANKRQKNYISQPSQASEQHDWVTQLKNPTPWFSWGGDLRLREIYADKFLTLSKKVPGHIWHFQRYRSRIWGKFKVAPDVTVNSRLVWEFRNWCDPHDAIFGRHKGSSINWDEAIFDKLNVEFKNFLGTPMKLKVGRQDIILGDGWLVLDGTPEDGSRTIFFDAVRGTIPFDKYNTLDAIYIDQHARADNTIKPFNYQKYRINGLTDQDERGVILNWANTSIVPKGKLEGYFIWKHDMPIKDLSPTVSNNGDIFAFGARAAGALDENWKYRAEFAQEYGHKNNFLGEYSKLDAFGFNSRLSYVFNDAHKNELHADYEYLSGDDPSTSTNEQFDPLWARWPRFSENYIYTYAMETRIAEVANLHRIAAGWTTNMTKKLQLCLDYHLLFAAENTRKDNPTLISFSNSGKFRGQLATAWLKYQYTKHISGHLMGEFFFPGNYYSHSNRSSSMMLRYELMLTF